MLKQLRNSQIFMAAFLAVALCLGGCAKQNPSTVAPIHAGAANSFDSNAYDTLVTAQAAIEQAKIGVAPSKKALLNQVIGYYNAAEAAYTAYHAAALAGSLTAGAQADLQGKLTTLTTGVTQLGAK